MRESLMYGSVRGTRGNSRPYRDALMLAVGTSRAYAFPIACPLLAEADMASGRGGAGYDLEATISLVGEQLSSMPIGEIPGKRS